MQKELSEKQKKMLGIVSIIIFIVFTLAVFLFIGIPIIRTARDPQIFRSWIDSMGVWGKLCYIALCFLQVLIAIIPGGPIEVAGGYAFGHVEATILSTIGLGLGSIAVFFLVRRFGRSLLEIFFSREKIEELKFLRTNRRRDLIILILFLMPGTPKDLLCFFCGLTDMPFSIFFLIAVLARIPAAWISSMGGSAMGRKSYSIAIMIAVIIVVLSILGVIAYRTLVRKHGRKEEKNNEN